MYKYVCKSINRNWGVCAAIERHKGPKPLYWDAAWWRGVWGHLGVWPIKCHWKYNVADGAWGSQLGSLRTLGVRLYALHPCPTPPPFSMALIIFCNIFARVYMYSYVCVSSSKKWGWEVWAAIGRHAGDLPLYWGPLGRVKCGLWGGRGAWAAIWPTPTSYVRALPPLLL